VWERFSHLNGYRMCSTNGVFKADSILQGSVGDCWFLSAVALVAIRPDIINHIVSTKPQIPDSGEIKFRLFFDGHWTSVTVDNLLPCRPPHNQGSISNAQPRMKNTSIVNTLHFSRCDSQATMWVPYLEKVCIAC
jgi:hypothetical protein